MTGKIGFRTIYNAVNFENPETSLWPEKQKKMDLQAVANPSRWVCIPFSIAVHPA